MSVQSQIIEAAATQDELLKVLSDTDHASPALKEQLKLVEDLRTHLRNSDHALKQLKTKRELNLKQHEKYRDSHVRRFMYKATGNREKFAEKASNGEQEYFDVLQQAQQENNQNAAVKQQLEDASRSRDELQSLSEVHDNAQRQLDDIYARIFNGQTEGFPEEDECESRCNGMLATYRECRGKWEAENSAMQALSAAIKSMDESIRHINSALSYSRWDMFGGGTMADAMERNALAKSDHAAMQAQLQVSKAQKASPFVQSLPNFNINHGHIFSDVFFDNIFTDMRFHEEIKRAAGELQRAEGAVKNELTKTKERQSALGTELSQRENELKRTREELQKIRSEIFEKVLNERGEKGAESKAVEV
ncbi:hypothetical protein VFPPC_06233 [Pochonia chlamydosporia 170]|uniref:Uncharacterized protein n=1 Tax=Pochonia chlamydosporia 170 TaxID=1380566 RepID=A0A179FJ47_METCM|nr:hypothetical protein VFPPC_06233 [Pochonia chlamydosporia 170]OAQ65059.1 hypothetical protein VFPPC_06233 [Pochonia chlamydosporia 170]